MIEPMLMEQWWVKAAPLAEKAIAAVEQGKTKFVPELVDQDVHALDDQHPGLVHLAPAVVGPSHPGVVLRRAARSRSRARRRPRAATCGGAELRQDEDILDTWFSSGLWPFSTLGWPDKTRELATFYPNNVLVTGPDIIFFWVARMMMMGLHFMGKVPFRTVYLTSIVTDENGDKMSKTKGNVHRSARRRARRDARAAARARRRREAAAIPRRVKKAIKKNFAKGIPAMGADALRFALAALNTGARGIRLSIERVEELPQLHQQAVERVAVRADEPRRLRPRALRGAARDAGRARARSACRSAGSCRACRRWSARSTPRSRRSASPTPRTRSITSCGTSCATGTSSSRSRTST